MSDDASARLSLPLLRAGQAQKEMFHNEALTLLDMLVQGTVVAVGVDTPPDSPVPGACWIVGTAPSGDWDGQANALAGWTAGGWRFVSATEGMTVWSTSDGAFARFSGGAWHIGELRGARVMIDGVQVVGPRSSAIADPSGGAAIDAEARTVIAGMLTVLRDHGLIAS